MSARLPALLGAAALLALAHAPAGAFEASGNAIADTFLGVMEAAGAETVSYDSVGGEGGAVTISGMTIAGYVSGQGVDGTSTLEVDTVTIEDGTVGSDGGLTASAIAFDGLTISSSEGGTLTARATAAHEVDLPSPDSMRATGGNVPFYSFYRSSEAEGILFTPTDGGDIPVERVTIAFDAFTDGMPSAGSFAIESISLDREAIDDELTWARLTALGYDTIDLTIRGTGSYDGASGTVDVSNLTFSAADMGDLSFTTQFSGVTPSVLQQLQANANNIEQLLALLNNVTVSQMMLSFDDNGVTDRMLEREASSAGIDKASYIEGVNQQLQALLAILGNPAFEDQVSNAVAAFLQSPSELTVQAAPQAPVPFAQLVGLAMMAPEALPAALGVTVTANE